MKYLILSADEVPEATKKVSATLQIMPVLLQDGTYALPETVLPYLPEFSERPLVEGSAVPFVIDME